MSEAEPPVGRAHEGMNTVAAAIMTMTSQSCRVRYARTDRLAPIPPVRLSAAKRSRAFARAISAEVLAW